MLAIKPASGRPFLRTSPELEKEIGDKTGKLLLQLDYWIRIGKNFIDGKWWTYQSTRDIQEKAFPGWALSTINRTIKRLEEMGLIEIANHNKAKYDKTRWFAIKAEGLARLQSIVLLEDEPRSEQKEPRSDQNGTRSAQNGTHSDQNGTTIPETPTETPTVNSSLITTSSTPARDDDDETAQSSFSKNVDDFKPQIPEVRPVKASDEGDDELMHPPAANESPRPIPPVPPRPPSPDDDTEPDGRSDLDDLKAFFTGCDEALILKWIARHGMSKIKACIKEALANKAIDTPPGYVRWQLETGLGGAWRPPKLGHSVVDEQDGKRYITGKYAAFIEH